MLGNIKNETTTPQVELLFRKRFLDLTTGFYWDRQGLYAPSEGSGILPYFNDNMGGGEGAECISDSWNPASGTFSGGSGCDEGETCVHGRCFPADSIDDRMGGDGIEIFGVDCQSNFAPADETSTPIFLNGNTIAYQKKDTTTPTWIVTGSSWHVTREGRWDANQYWAFVLGLVLMVEGGGLGFSVGLGYCTYQLFRNDELGYYTNTMECL